MNTKKYGIGLEVQLFGIYLGPFYGDLKEGLGISIDIIAAQGEVRIYLRDGAGWVRIQLKTLCGSGINIEQKLFDFPEQADS